MKKDGSEVTLEPEPWLQYSVQECDGDSVSLSDTMESMSSSDREQRELSEPPAVEATATEPFSVISKIIYLTPCEGLRFRIPSLPFS